MKRTVLVVDDDAHIREVLAMRLEALGCTVTTAAGPAEALRAVDAGRFDLALVDLRMEPMDGIALMKAIHEGRGRIPVIIMTAHGTIEAAVQAIKDGAYDFLTKPFVPEELRTKVAHAFAERRWAHDRALLQLVGETLASACTLERMFDVVAEATLEATESERSAVFLRVDGRALLKGTSGPPGGDAEDLHAAAEAAMAQRAPVAREREARVTLAVPLLVDAVAQGAIAAVSRPGVVPTDEDREVLTLFAAQATVALRNAQELDRARSGALTALGSVAAQVAHELNNPLGGLKLYARLLQDRLAKADDVSGVDLVEKADRAIDRLATLVKDISAYGRPPELHRAPVELNHLVEECLALAEDRVAEKAITVTRDLDPSLGLLSLDAAELQKVLLNLVLNAVEAMENGGRLAVTTHRAGDTAEIVIEDNGCGMDEATRGRMFELFFTTKARGTGLGMAIVRSCVERHGGRLAVDTSPGRGTRVRVELPIENG